MLGNGRYRAPRQSKTQSKYQSTVQSKSPVQSPEYRVQVLHLPPAPTVNTVGKVTWHSRDPFCRLTSNISSVIHYFSDIRKRVKDSLPTLAWTFVFGNSVVAIRYQYVLVFCTHDFFCWISNSRVHNPRKLRYFPTLFTVSICAVGLSYTLGDGH